MSTSNTAILDQILDPLTRCLTPQVARSVAALRATSEVQRRMEELADKSAAGTLSPQEQAEYDTWGRAVNFMGMLQAKARLVMAGTDSR